jgi:D-glycero-D-manno-heptose 1,7-bisphosphate phosphatase
LFLPQAEDRGKLTYWLVTVNSSEDGKAIFLDRDGVINALVYHQEPGIIDAPFTVAQFGLLPYACEAIKKFQEMGYRVILASNQPGVAKGHLTAETFEKIREKMNKELARGGTFLDGEYYCFHHPEARIDKLKVRCHCRKPKPGLLLQAAEEMQIDLSRSWMIGDGITDIKAGKSAGTRTILLGKMKCELCRIIEEEDASPDAICPNLLEAIRVIDLASNNVRSHL